MRAPGVEYSVAHRPAALRRRPPQRRAQQWRAVAFWVGGSALIFGLSFLAVAFALPGMVVALWWPAAGVSAVLVLRARAAHRPSAVAIVLVVTTLGNLFAGRPVGVSALYGAANAVEVALLAWLLLRGREDARLRTTNDAVRFVAWAAVAALVFALTIALINAVLGSADALPAALATGASHFSAVLLIVPLALFDPQPQSPPAASELVGQFILMVVVLAAGLGPLTRLPLAFLVFVPLAWATLRFPPLLAHLQALAIAVVTVVYSRVSVGVFATSTIDTTELSITVTIFLSAIAIFAVSTTTERNESLVNARTAVDAAETAAEAARATAATLQVRYDLERQRQDFLSTTSHELRTPVTIIAGYTELLGEIDLPSEARPWVDAIHRNTGRLAGMLDDLLSFSRTQAERPRPTDIAATDLVTTVVSRHVEVASARDLAVTVGAIGDLGVIADRDDAIRALGNLVSNAVKFTPDGGRVHIEATDVAGDVMITVSDTGPGISPDALGQVFDPFYRGEQSEVRAMPGTGLGLPIARMLARRNGGEVMLVSLPGHGTKATLLLPRVGGADDLDESAEDAQ